MQINDDVLAMLGAEIPDELVRRVECEAHGSLVNQNRQRHASYKRHVSEPANGEVPTLRAAVSARLLG